MSCVDPKDMHKLFARTVVEIQRLKKCQMDMLGSI